MKNAANYTNTIQIVHKTNHVCSTMTIKVAEKLYICVFYIFAFQEKQIGNKFSRDKIYFNFQDNFKFAVYTYRFEVQI